MIRKMFIALLLMVSSLLFADEAGAQIWLQMNNATALNLDLSSTIPLPSANSSWNSSGYSNTNYLGKVGNLGITDPVYIEVSCSKVDSEGNFIMGSDSNRNVFYRKFKVGFAYRISNASNTHSNYKPSGSSTSFFSIGSNTSSPYPLPACSSSTLYSWIDLLIILDDYTSNGDEPHLSSANDYTTVLTLIVHTEDNRYYQTLSIPLMGYYDSTPNSMSGECFFNIIDYGQVINLKEMTKSDSINVGQVEFHTISMNKNTNKSYTLSISPSDLINDTSDFLMKRVSKNVISFDDTNSVPLEVLLNGKIVTGTSTRANSISSSSSRSVETTVINQDSSGNISSVTGETMTKSFGYNADVYIKLNPSYDLNKLNRLLSGEYYMNIYFFVTVDT